MARLLALLAALGLVAAAPAAADWTTYHGNGARTGAAKRGPAPEKTRRLWTRKVDGAVYAEPLVAGTRVVVATENDTLYAFDARSGKRRWRRHLAQPVPRTDIEAGLAPGCGNIDPTGITSTPVIDERRGVVLAAGFVRNPLRHVLFAVSLRTGKVRWRRKIDPPGVDPRSHQQRAALALSKGRVYTSYGGLAGDCGKYNGWVVGAPASGRGKTIAWRVPSGNRAGIWGASGPAVGGGGSLFVATGNSDSADEFDYGDAVVRLTPALAPVDYFTPADYGHLNVADEDLGSVGPLLLPGHRAFAIGKSGVGYLLDTRELGGVGHPLRSFGTFARHDSYGGLAYAGGEIFVPFRGDGLAAIRLRSGNRLSLGWRRGSFFAGAPVVAGPAAWVLAIDQSKLRAYGRVSGRLRFSASVPQPATFATPAVAGRRIYVAGERRLVAFGEWTTAIGPPAR
jgi:hypothetical protein